MHLHLRSAQRTVEEAAEKETLLIGEVLGQGDAELRTFALDAVRQGAEGVGPGRLQPTHGGDPQSRRVVDIGVVEATAIADPALVDLIVLARCHTYQLASPLPQSDVAAHRALRAHAFAVGHVPWA